MNEKTESRASRALKAAGWILAAASVAYIAVKIARSPAGGLSRFITPVIVLTACALSFAYSLLNLLLAWCWAVISRISSSRVPPLLPLMKIHLRTGIVKYLPGNVFHLAGRHVLAGGAGAGQGAVLAANILEMGTIVVASLAIVAVVAGLGYLDAALAFLRGRFDTAGVIIAVLVLAAAAGALGAYLAGKYRRLLNRSALRTMMVVFTCYLGFFAVAALLLHVLCSRLSGAEAPSPGYLEVLGVFCLSWMAGFAVPGAPGGLGIRESVMIAALAPSMGDGGALAAALLLRAVTVGGDVHSFFYSFIIRKDDQPAVRYFA